jgi:hypothetical protein
MKPKLTFLLALTFLLTLFNNCYAGEITGSRKIVLLSLEKYVLPIIQSFNISKLKRIGFDRADKTTTTFTPLEGEKNINGYLVTVRGMPQKENEPNIMIGTVLLTGSMKMQLPSFGIAMSEKDKLNLKQLQAELPIMHEMILMYFGKSLVSGGWKLLTFNRSIEDQSNLEDSSLSLTMRAPKLETYIKSKFPSLEFKSFYLDATRKK